MYSLFFLNRHHNAIEKVIGLESIDAAVLLADGIRDRLSPNRWFPHLITQEDLPGALDDITVWMNEVYYEVIL